MTPARPTHRPIAVLDVDGVLADVRHRLHHIAGPVHDWDAFFAAAGEDPPVRTGCALAAELAVDHDLCYVTGRPERLRRVTEGWLVRHRLPPGRLLMRPDGDRRPARLLKPRLVRDAARSGPVAVVVDDDADVCDALTAAGWPVRRAGWATDSPTLRDAQQRSGRS